MARLLRSITLPLLTPTMFFVVITLLINYFQMFEQVWLMPMRDSAADRQLERHRHRGGHATPSATTGWAMPRRMSWVLFVIIFIITFVQLRLQKRWVYYELESRRHWRASTRRPRWRARRPRARWLAYRVMILLVLVMVLPFVWMLSTSLKTQEYILQHDPAS